MTILKFTLIELGFSPHFMSQLDLDELEQLIPIRITEVQRDRLFGLSENGQCELALPPSVSTGEIAVGDWVLSDTDNRFIRTLTPLTALNRRSAGTDVSVQHIANNVNTLFIVSSCNDDFNEARIERYLALASESGVAAVVLLTKADLSNNSDQYRQRAEKLMHHLPVLLVNATDSSVVAQLEPWCGAGETVALLGSSGVGKTTLLNALTGGDSLTQAIRQDDAKGRHTTTYRSMMPILNGGWVIDTPGMRALRLQDTADGIDAVFEEITEAASRCRYADCQHQNEPDCAVLAAIENGDMEHERLQRWRKLAREDIHNTQSIADARKRQKQFTKSVNRTVNAKQGRRSNDH